MTTPGSVADDDFYDAAPLEPHLLYQGEILIDVPLVIMPKPARWLLLRTKSGKRLDEALDYGKIGNLARVLDSNQFAPEWDAAGDGDFAMARLAKRPVVVLNQNCDIETKDFLQIAPIYPSTDAALIENLKRDEVYSAFRLAAHPPEIAAESFADFEQIQAVHKSYVKRLLQKQHFRLSPANVRSLQRSITRYFGRPNAFDADADQCPRTGTYLCTTCFYFDGVVTKQDATEGTQFARCGRCQGRFWAPKGPTRLDDTTATINKGGRFRRAIKAALREFRHQ